MRPVKGWWLCLALLAGCGGTSAASQASPTPNLGAEYTRIVAPGNACLDTIGAAVRATPQDNPRIRAAAAACQTADGKLNSDLLVLRAEAPANIRADIDSLRKAVAAQEALMGAIATATDANIAVAVIAYGNYSDGGAASLMRSDLGLAPPPNATASP